MDDVVWEVIGKGKGQCSYKQRAHPNTFCTNEMNLTGQCARKFCPLANSRYATILYRKGKVILCMKTIERAHTPAKLWEKVELDANYLKALGQIDKELEFWPSLYIHKCKQRLTKIFQMVRRMRKLRKQTGEKLVVINKKLEKREQMREVRAARAAAVTDQIAQELQYRVKQRIKSGAIFNQNGEAFQEFLSKKEREIEELKQDERVFEEDLDSEQISEEDEEGFFEQMKGFRDIEELQQGYVTSEEEEEEEEPEKEKVYERVVAYEEEAPQLETA